MREAFALRHVLHRARLLFAGRQRTVQTPTTPLQGPAPHFVSFRISTSFTTSISTGSIFLPTFLPTLLEQARPGARSVGTAATGFAAPPASCPHRHRVAGALPPSSERPGTPPRRHQHPEARRIGRARTAESRPESRRTAARQADRHLEGQRTEVAEANWSSESQANTLAMRRRDALRSPTRTRNDRLCTRNHAFFGFAFFLGLGAGSSSAVMRTKSRIQSLSSIRSPTSKQFFAPG